MFMSPEMKHWLIDKKFESTDQKAMNMVVNMKFSCKVEPQST